MIKKSFLKILYIQIVVQCLIGYLPKCHEIYPWQGITKT